MDSSGTLFDTKDQASPGFYGPSQTALLLMDFHALFIAREDLPAGKIALRNAVELRAWAKQQGISVIHCLVDIDGKPFATCKNAAMFAQIIATMKAGGGEEAPELLKHAGEDVTFTRQPGHVSVLKSPGLPAYLRQNGIKSLILTGLSTSGCVSRTSLAAADAEYVVTTISDGCADPDQDAHDMAIAKLLNNRGYTATATEFREGFEKAQRGR